MLPAPRVLPVVFIVGLPHGPLKLKVDPFVASFTTDERRAPNGRTGKVRRVSTRSNLVTVGATI